MKKISYAQNFEDILLLRAFGEQKNGFYIDIGCHHPIEDSVTYNFYKLGWNGINIDPDESFNDLYKDLRPNDLMINTTVSDKSDTNLDFYLVKETGLSSFNIENLDKNNFFINKIKVSSKTLDEIINENNLENQIIDIIKIDAEGYEKKIIEGWNSNFLCKCVVYEITNLKDEDKRFIIEKLNLKGFELVFEDGINNYLINNKYSELKKFFKYPVNINDNYITYNYYKNITLKENEKNDLKRMYFGIVNILNERIQDSFLKKIRNKEFHLNLINKFKVISVELFKILYNFLPKFLSNKLLLFVKKLFPNKWFYLNLNTNDDQEKKTTFENINQTQINLQNNIKKPKQKKILIDLSEILKRDIQTGIQRVSKKITINLLKKYNEINNDEKNFELKKTLLDSNVQIIGCRDGENFYRYVNFPTLKLIEIIEKNKINQVIDLKNDDLFPKYNFKEGDIFLGLDYCVNPILQRFEFLKNLKKNKINIYFFVYDLLPVNNPEWFFKRVKNFTSLWLQKISQFDGVFCISKNTRDDYLKFIKKNKIFVKHNFTTDVIPLGYDLNNTDHTLNESILLETDKKIIDFLIVGTIEPRKAHIEMLKVFELLWGLDKQVRLTVVGKVGWMADYTLKRFINSPHFKEHFFYFSQISDEELSEIYKKTDVLIIPSYNEGFGLPIIEATKYKKHILARNIPVFREIIGENGNFFPDTNTNEILLFLVEWIKNLRNGKIKKYNIKYQTWKNSTNKLMELINKNVSL